MAEPFVGEIRMFPYSYAPRNWAWCNGQTLSIYQSTMLYAIIGITYGGDGVKTFALPDLRGRTPMHSGQGPGLSYKTTGERGGHSSVILSNATIPSHKHNMYAVESNGCEKDCSRMYVSKLVRTVKGRTAIETAYEESPSNNVMSSYAVGNSGIGEPHHNRQPYLAVHFCIAMDGLFPPRT